MKVCKNRLIKSILFALALSVFGTSWAVVKLRVYLKDGTLQSGNLVAERDDAFVLLTKTGRVEIPKNVVMFVNGKTLQQWQKNPDKSYQTEIIPKEIPNPSFVLDKAAPPPPMAPLTVERPSVVPTLDSTDVSSGGESEDKSLNKNVRAEKEPPAPSGTTRSTQAASDRKTESRKESPLAKKPPAVSPVSTPIASNAPEKSTSTERAEKPKSRQDTVSANTSPIAPAAHETKKPSEAASSLEGKPDWSRKAASSKAKRKKTIVQNEQKTARAVEIPVAREATPVSRPAPYRGKFDRNVAADRHYANALILLDQGEKGQAIQELHIAFLMDRRRPETSELLGKLYMEAGLYEQAKKFFEHPALKKKGEISDRLAMMEESAQSQEKEAWKLFWIAGGGVFLSVPAVLIARAIRRRVRRSRVITADNIDELQEVTAERPAGSIEMEKTRTLEAPPLPLNPPEIKEVVSAEPPMPVGEPMPRVDVAPPAPELPRERKPVPVEEQTIELILPPMPEQTPIVPEIAFSSAHEEENVPPPPIGKQPVESPVPIPPAPAPFSPVDDYLEVGSLVDAALQQANEMANAGKLDPARREYRTALALNPKCVEAYLGLGYLSFIQGQWDLAFAHYVRALGVDPSCAEAYYGIGRVLVETERTEESIPQFQKALELDPTFDSARDTLTALGQLV